MPSRDVVEDGPPPPTLKQDVSRGKESGKSPCPGKGGVVRVHEAVGGHDLCLLISHGILSNERSTRIVGVQVYQVVSEIIDGLHSEFYVGGIGGGTLVA